MEFLFIALGGALGAILRYLLADLIVKITGKALFWGTWGVNLLGCLAIGVLWSLSQSFTLPPYWRLLLFTGFLGAFTTFSTFSLEGYQLFSEGKWKLAFCYIVSSNVLGVSLVLAGVLLGKKFGTG